MQQYIVDYGLLLNLSEANHESGLMKQEYARRAVVHPECVAAMVGIRNANGQECRHTHRNGGAVTFGVRASAGGGAGVGRG